MNRIFFILPHNILSFNKNCFIHDYLLEPELDRTRSNNNQTQKLTFFFFLIETTIYLLTLNCRSCDDIYDSSVFETTNGAGRTKPGAIRSRFIVVRGDRLTNNNPGDSALTSSRKIRSEATLYCSRNCMQRHSFRLGTRIHRA